MHESNSQVNEDAGCREHGEKIPEHIARTAARLFASRGYDATSVREIVEASGVSRPTLYYHFGSKEALAQALLNVPLESVTAKLDALLAAGGDPVETLSAMIEVHFACFREDPDRARFLYALFFGPLGSGLAAEIGKFSERFNQMMWLGVDRLVQGGVIEADRASGFLAAVRGLIVVSSVDFLYQGRNLDPGLARQLVDDLLRGFGRTRGSQPE